MKKEKIILSLISLALGIIVAIGIFYLYQSRKQVSPKDIEKITLENVTPTPESHIFLIVDKPSDEQVVDTRNITVSGKTVPNAKIVILTQTNEEAAVAASDGSFTTNITIDQGENIVEVDAIATNGETAKVKRVVTYTTESF